MAGRGTVFHECHPEACPGTLGPWLFQSPHSRQPEHRLEGEWRKARKGCPHSCLPGPGLACSYIGPNFLLITAGLDQDNVQIWHGGCGQVRQPGSLLDPQALLHTRWALYQQVWVKMSTESYAHLSPLLAPTVRGQVFPQTLFPRPVSESAACDCRGWGRQVSCTFVHRACTSGSQKFFLSARWKPGTTGLLVAGLEGDQWRPA